MLELEGLEVAHGDAVAVWDVSLVVGARELVTVVGPNGAGKTTLIDAIAGLLPIRAGRVRLDGRDLASVPAHELCRHGIALVPEGRRLFPAMTVGEISRSAATRRRRARGAPRASSASTRRFRSCASAGDSSPARSPADSSRWSRSGAR
jgi:branched-chain amino acid transport system ATP-binding protein